MAHKSEPGSPLNVALEVTNMVPPMSSTTRPCWCSYQDTNFTSVTLAVMDLCTFSRLMLFTRRVGVDTTCLLLTRHVVLDGGGIIMLEASSVSVGPTDRLTRSTASVTFLLSLTMVRGLSARDTVCCLTLHLLLITTFCTVASGRQLIKSIDSGSQLI